jgi:hypothetical protein
MMTRRYLGIGLIPAGELAITPRVTLRKARIHGDIAELERIADTQWSYGFLCALAPQITFELETTGENAEDLATEHWNAQWALMLLVGDRSASNILAILHSTAYAGAAQSESGTRERLSLACCVQGWPLLQR